MALDPEDEILQDFLVEAGEILERLSEQLVDLEQRPDDKDLLNAVFRGFHTVKGGAGFLNLTPMVSVCHCAEDLFNLLRNGQRQVTSGLMDSMLTVLDVLNRMFTELRAGQEPGPADPALLERLEGMVAGVEEAVEAGGAAELAPPPAAAAPPAVASNPAPTPDPVAPAEGAEGDITDDEFEALLDAMHGKGAPAAVAAKTDTFVVVPTAPASGDEISEAEFEALLDQLHGPGRHSGAAETAVVVDAPKPRAAGDEIDEDEFEALLDQLHGKGRHAGAPAAPATATPVPANRAAEVAAPKAAARAPAPERDKGEKDAAVETTVRVDTKRLDDIMNMVGELVLVRNRLARLEVSLADPEMSKAVANLDVVTGDLQTAAMKTRMQPIKKVFGRFPRVVRDLSRSLNKEVRLELRGEETDLDKNLVEALADPLVHLVRNAVDHGIDMPDEREAAGKPRTGTIVLSAEQEGDHILLLIEDDGRGMDPEVLRAKAVEKGMMDADAAARLDRSECFNLIMEAGFSTKTEISDISGRGVGMDVVKNRITELNGTVEIDSTMGKGTRVAIKVPLTLAIMPTLMVRLKDQLFALPLASVSEIFHLDLTRTNTVDGQLVVLVRDKSLPLFYLSRWLIKKARGEALPQFGHVVVVHLAAQRIGFVVDHLIGQEEVVIKPLGSMLHGTRGLAGATITGDGRIALILDVPGLLKAYARRYA